MRDVSLDEFAATEEDAGEERSDGADAGNDSSVDRGDEDPSESEGQSSAPGEHSPASDQAEPAADSDADIDHSDEPVDDHDIVSTAAWSTSGRVCEECGAPATRLWRQSGRLVCPACKQWG